MTYPHQNVKVRLFASPIHNVGVKAIVPIKVKEEIFPRDSIIYIAPNNGLSRGIEVRTIKEMKLPKALYKLYLDYAGKADPNIFFCVDNFNNLCINDYINHSYTPNVAFVDGYYTAIKNIKVGEELTIDYTTFSRVARRRLK